MPAYTEARIKSLCAEALAAKSPADVDRIVAELRVALEEHTFLAKALLEGQFSNLAFLDRVARWSSSEEKSATTTAPQGIESR